MTPIFVLTYPRSRTSWLTTYLHGGGEMAYHELWKVYPTMYHMRRFMDGKGCGSVVNVDCANWFFIPEIRTAYPHAQFIRIDRNPEEVVESARALFGEYDFTPMMKAYEKVMAHSDVKPILTVDFDKWTPDVSLQIWDAVSKHPIDLEWHALMHDMMIEPTREAIERWGALDMSHLQRKLGR